MLKVRDLEFGYGKEPVLRDVDIDLDRGEVLGIIGPNGSGKSTLLKCINRILKPWSGQIDFRDLDLDDMSMPEIARRIGYVPQGSGRYFPATVFDTILLGRTPHIRWRPTGRDLEVVTRVVRALELEEVVLREINELSGGQRQRVMIGRALAQEPEVMLLDEPTANLDLKHQMEVLGTVRAQAGQGISSLMAIHDLSLAGRFCDRFVMLREGRVFARGGPEILTPVNIEAVYDIRVEVMRSKGRLLVVPEGADR